MEKVIKIDNKEIKLNNNAVWTMEYRDQFGEDILPKVLPLVGTVTELLASIMDEMDGEKITVKNLAESVRGRAFELLMPMIQADFVDLVVNVIWAMAKAADEDIDPPKQWLKQFDSFPVDVIVPEVYGLAFKGLVSSKNLKRLKGLIQDLKKVKSLQPSE